MEVVIKVAIAAPVDCIDFINTTFIAELKTLAKIEIKRLNCSCRCVTSIAPDTDLNVAEKK